MGDVGFYLLPINSCFVKFQVQQYPDSKKNSSWIIWVFPKIGYPQIIQFNRVFHYKPSILGYPYFWKHPYRCVRFFPQYSLQKSPYKNIPFLCVSFSQWLKPGVSSITFTLPRQSSKLSGRVGRSSSNIVAKETWLVCWPVTEPILP